MDALRSLNLSLPSTRSSKQIYPIAPREVVHFFLEENILVLARDVQRSLMTTNPALADVRNYLRHSLWPAFEVMTEKTYRPTDNEGLLLDDESFMPNLLRAVKKPPLQPRV